MADHQYLSIGEVLGLLLEDFPDVTISKIRFLESQGLIEPERTPSGYRKFYDGDVELLRAILHEQKANFLPLKVIRDRIESGAIDSDSTGGRTPPRGIRNVEQREAREQRESTAGSDSAAEPESRDSVFRRTDGGPEWAGGQALIPGETDGVLHAAAAPQSPITAAVPIVPAQPPTATTVERRTPAASASPSSSTAPSSRTPSSATTARPGSADLVASLIEPVGRPETAPADTSGSAVASSTGPSDTTPADTTTSDATPADTTPADSAPADRASAHSAPAETTADDSAPSVTTAAAATTGVPGPGSASRSGGAPAVSSDATPLTEPSAAGAATGRTASHLRSAASGGVRELPYNPAELCEAASITPTQLAELLDYGIVSSRGSGADSSFRPEAVEIARIAGQLLSQGIDARHLRAWRQAAERESALFEQRIMPLLRQRNPQARQTALSSLTELSGLGAQLHNALVDSLLQHHFDS